MLTKPNNIYLIYMYKEDLEPTMADMTSNQTKPNPIYLIYVYKEDLVLNNLQWLICHKT